MKEEVVCVHVWVHVYVDVNVFPYAQDYDHVCVRSVFIDNAYFYR